MISVIVPAYNAALTIQNTLEDLLKQTCSDMEIIVINDGSTDQTLAIVQEYEKKDHRLRVVDTKNQGVSAARNRGIEEAKGDYITFMDADDRLGSASIESFTNAVRSNPDIDLVIGDFYSFPQEIRYYQAMQLDGRITCKEYLTDFCWNFRSFYYGVVWNKLYKLDIIKRHGIRFDISLFWCEDCLFNIEYAKHVSMVFYLHKPEYSYGYFVNPNGVVRTYMGREELLQEAEKKRYQKAAELFATLEVEDSFYLEWKYSEQLQKISELVFEGAKGSLKNRYRNFKTLLSDKDFVRYIALKADNTYDNLQLKIIEKVLKKKHICRLFCFLWIKHQMGNIFPRLKQAWKRFHRDLPF